MIAWLTVVAGGALLVGIGWRETKRRRLGEILPPPDKAALRTAFRFPQ